MKKKIACNPTWYSKLFVLVCNIPNENEANSMESHIIAGLKKKWGIKHDDPLYEKIHIIFLHKNDMLNDPKFKVLQQVDENSKIIIVGSHLIHLAAHEPDYLVSDEIYFSIDENKFYSHRFTFAFLADILLKNINNPRVIFERDPSAVSPNYDTPARKLKIVIAACNSAVEKFGRSFAGQFFNYLINATDKFIHCSVTGANAYLYPIASSATWSSTVKFFLGDKEHNIISGFHRRYARIPAINHSVFQSIPRHKPNSYSYKTEFILDNPSNVQLYHSQLQIKKLSVKEAKNDKLVNDTPNKQAI